MIPPKSEHSSDKKKTSSRTRLRAAICLEQLCCEKKLNWTKQIYKHV